MQTTMLEPTLLGRVLSNPSAGVQGLTGLRSEFDRLFDQFLGATAPAWSPAASWPPLNVWEDADHLYVEAELPGMSLEQIDLTLERDGLTLRGERGGGDSQNGSQQGTWLHRERGTGRFERSIGLPMPVDVDGVEARLEQGVLTVRLPKAQSMRARKIEVKKG